MNRWLRNVPRPELIAVATSVIVSVALLVIKFIAYYLTGSAAIFSDALESVVNVLSSMFAAYSLFLAHQPADEEHPYGHGKVEFMSAGFEGGMILLAAFIIIVRAIQAFVQGSRITSLDAGLTLMVVAAVVNGVVGKHLVAAGKRAGSVTLTADGRHLLSDAVTSVGVVAALVAVRVTGWRYFDPIAAVILAIYIGMMALRVLNEAVGGLMDKQDAADERMLRDILDSHVGPSGKQPQICSYHKLRHRHSGRYHWVDFHIVVPANWNITYGHEVASAIEYEIEQALGEGNATAHVEPCIDPACAACARKKEPS